MPQEKLMTPQERDVISGIFDKLKSAASQPRDPEVERLIAEKIAAQPYAPYAMAQSVYVQEQALLNLQQQVEALQAQVVQLQNQPQAPQGGFLSGIFGAKPAATTSVPNAGRPIGVPPGFQSGAMQAQASPQGAVQPQTNQPPAGPWGGQPRQGGGFLQTAMATAAGVAGGVVLGNVLMNAFSGDKAGAQTANKPEAAAEASPASTEASAAQDTFQPASHEDTSGGFDTGFDDGGGDWA
jgi:uncharacterized protein